MSSITLRFLAYQPDALSRDKIRGGTLLRWMDEAGFACGCAWARGRCVTAFISSATFAHAVRAGQLVQVEARLAYTGTTSMALAIEVHAHDLSSQQPRLVTHCVAVYVAVDEDDKPIPVDTWRPETPGDIALAQRVKGLITAARAAQ
ncbi:MAG: acyl-CoA thioesterase [Giesbergeria sp.]|nr:acyl-CoA thioesterase [Giesbergeria sp.]